MSQKENKEFDILELASQVSKFIEKNFKFFLGLFVGLIVAGSVWSMMSSAAKAEQEQAFGELYKITKTYSEKKENFAEAKREKESKNKNTGDKDQVKTEDKKGLKEATGDLQKDYGDEVTKLEAFLKANLGKNASGEAALVLSEIYDEYKQPQKGAEALAMALSKWSEQNVLYYVMQMRTGDLWASVNECEKAVTSWQAVAGSKSFIAKQAQLKLGVCLQQIGRMDEAKKWFQQIANDENKSSESFSAKRYLRYLEFKSKNSAEKTDDKAQSTKKTEDKKS